MPAAKKKYFNISARIVVITSQPVVANSFEEAFAAAGKLRVTDFVDVLGEHNDSSIRIESVSADGMWKTDDF